MTQQLPSLADSTKANTLRKLQGKVRRSTIDPFLIFTVSQWQDDPEKILIAVKSEFGGTEVIVRSSALSEDGPGFSHAGYFKSEPASSGSSSASLRSAVEKVLASYSRDKRPVQPEDQIIVQKRLVKAACAGVLLTRDWPSLAPYYVINFDDQSGRTDTVTKGLFAHQVWIARWEGPSQPPDRWASLLAAVQEIELLVGADSLQIEFALDELRTVHVFQVRPLIHPEIYETPDDLAVQRLVHVLELELQERPWHFDFACPRTLADMSDWNPAEMLGSRCNPLDYSLYRALITESTWNRARVALGYADVTPHELMTAVADKPYIDVAVSLHSLTPAGIPGALRNRLVSFGIEKLCRHPELQDKVEFSLAFSCLDFSFESRAKELRDSDFSSKDVETTRAHLLLLTNKLLAEGGNTIKAQMRRVRNLECFRKRLSWRYGSPLPLEEACALAQKLLLRCRDLGVFPFAQLARLSFIGVALLRSMSYTELDFPPVSDFLPSVRTVAGRLTHDLNAVHQGRLDSVSFLKRYGHLRPGTYNVLVPRLDQMPNLFDQGNEICRGGQAGQSPKRNLARYPKHIDSRLRMIGLTSTLPDLLEFTTKALQARELAKFYFTRTLSDLLELVAQIGESVDLSREDTAFLDVDTLMYKPIPPSTKAAGSVWRRVIEQRQQEKHIYRSLSLPPVLASSDDLTRFEHYIARPNFVTQKRVEGPVAVLGPNSYEDASILAGRVVLIENADPGYDWLFSCRVVGVVTKYGGVASHMAIRCGEFRMPAAIGCGEVIYNSLSAGSRICIDGQAEAVFIV